MLDEKLNRIFDIADGGKDNFESDSQKRIQLRKGTDILQTDDEQNIQLAKDNLKGMIEASSHALEELINISVQSQSNKHFDSLANMIKALNESNKFLYEMATIKTETPNSQQNIQNNTAVFVGSTTELLRALKENR